MESLTVSEARARLPEILDRVEAGEEITITRHGRPPPYCSDRTPSASGGVRAPSTGRGRSAGCWRRPGRPPPLPPTMSVERAEELIAEIRADRDGR